MIPPICMRFTIAPCDLGHLLLAAGERGICQLRLGDDPDILSRRFCAAFPNARGAAVDDPLHGWSDAIVRRLNQLESQDAETGIPLELAGTPFQRRVWSALCAIPRGETRSYGEIADAINLPKGARAVASACARNPVALLVPCHRVLPRSGGTGGYRWGSWRKRWLLERERVEPGGSDAIRNAFYDAL